MRCTMTCFWELVAGLGRINRRISQVWTMLSIWMCDLPQVDFILNKNKCAASSTGGLDFAWFNDYLTTISYHVCLIWCAGEYILSHFFFGGGGNLMDFDFFFGGRDSRLF